MREQVSFICYQAEDLRLKPLSHPGQCRMRGHAPFLFKCWCINSVCWCCHMVCLTLSSCGLLSSWSKMMALESEGMQIDPFMCIPGERLCDIYHNLFNAELITIQIRCVACVFCISWVPDQNGISRLYHAWDIPFWSDTLNMYVWFSCILAHVSISHYFVSAPHQGTV